MQYTDAIVRKPGQSIRFGTSKTLHMGRPDYEKAMEQHDAFVAALMQCGVNVVELPALEDYPDSCFVGDVAVVAGECVVLCNPASPMRKGEVDEIEPVIRGIFPDENIHSIHGSATMEGSDIVISEKHLYVNEGQRTNGEAVMQLGHILREYGMSCSGVRLRELPYLRAGMSYLGDGCMTVAGELGQAASFFQFFRIEAPGEEEHAANCLSVNGTVIVPDEAPQMADLLMESGYKVSAVDISEFRKIDGGLSDLCILFNRSE